jgi:D-methionine transport system permease protein
MGDITLGVLLPDLGTAMVETGIMVGTSLLLALVLGLPLGFLLFLTRQHMLLENRALNFIGGLLINFVRSLPFVILLILVIPLSMVVTGRSTGPIAATVPLAIASIAFYARLVETSLCEVNAGVIEASRALGASYWLIIKEVLFPESLAGLIRGFTMTAISLIGYSAMAGVVGGGGIGFLAINYGYYRYETGVMIITVILLILIVQSVQSLGVSVSNNVDRKKK